LIYPDQFVLGINGNIGLGRKAASNRLEVGGNASKSMAGDWLGNSDRRLKKNISSISEQLALETLLQMRGIYYEWNDTVSGYERPEGRQMGFIAQELLEILPDKVSQDAQGYFQTAYGDYDPLFVQAIKAVVQRMEDQEKMILQQSSQIEELTKLVFQLKDQIDQMEGNLDRNMVAQESTVEDTNN
jgi:hypothetical protein